MLIPLPPYNEQIRIVEKIEKLIKICKNLEQNLKENQAYSDFLRQSTLQEAFAHNYP
jgi:type I restriction enzyme, S subunit